MSGKFISIIIPTWNMGKYLEPLLTSILGTPLADAATEVIFVCDKSTDGSEDIIRGLEAKYGAQISIRLIVPPERKGLFYARYLGAQASKGQKILFIDSRITLSPRTTQSLPELLRKYPALSANVDIDVQKNIFCLYWERSHSAVFAKTYQARQAEFSVGPENYNEFRIGGTCFACSRDIFVRLSEKYLGRPLLSDDTLLMRDIVEHERFHVHPDFRINWEPRDEWKPFLKHLYVRGPGFAEYHIFEHQGWLFWAVMLGLFGLLLTFVLLLIHPLLALSILGFGLLGMALSTLALARSPLEFVRLAPLHVGVLLAYGIGALRGIYVVYKRRRQFSLQK